VISFGTKTAWFEVWVNFVRATLICRYGWKVILPTQCSSTSTIMASS
jgi:hypothetical protein